MVCHVTDWREQHIIETESNRSTTTDAVWIRKAKHPTNQDEEL